MYIKFEKDGDLSSLEAIVRTFDMDDQINGIMIFTCYANKIPDIELNTMLKSLSTQVFGGIFPSVIFDGEKKDIGSIVIAFNSEVSTQIVHNMSGAIDTLQIELESFYLMMGEGKTFLINLDGLSEGVEVFKEELFYTLGLSKNYIGGGAGSLTGARRPCVISNEGLLMDAAVIALVDIYSGVGVAHGWENVSDPVKITESNRNTIISLDWEPALTLYKKKVEALADVKFTSDNFFEIAKGYPFGISKMDNEMVVRDPFEIVEDTSIACVGAVPQNDFLYILTGDSESIINGAKSAKSLARKAFIKEHGQEPSEKSVTLLIDCISRSLFLGDDFSKELEVIGKERLIGALSLGEFANTGKSYLEFYNKTSVIGILEA